MNGRQVTTNLLPSEIVGQGNIYAELSSDSPLDTCLNDRKFYNKSLSI